MAGASNLRVSQSGLRRRVLELAGYRVLSDGEAAAILADDTSRTINEGVTWTVRASPSGVPSELRTQVNVYNSRGERLTLCGRIPLTVPGRSHWMLIWGDKADQEHPVNLRRLDLRDDHVNPDRQRWRQQTHKHTWSSVDDNDIAYTPDDIPHDSDAGVDVADDYRAVFEAFASECKIDFGPDYSWEDPPTDLKRSEMLWEVP